MKIDAFFDTRLRNASPDERLFDQGIDRAERFGRILGNDADMGVMAYEVGGSCGKRTALDPLNDADLFVYLDPARWFTRRGAIYQPSSVLGEFARRLETTQRAHINRGDVRIRPQEHSIRVRYAGKDSTDVEVVPAMWDGNAEYFVQIPERGSRSWVHTSVARQKALLQELDSQNHYLRRGIRLLKLLKRQARLALRSYAIEVLALSVAAGECGRHPSSVFLKVLEVIGKTGLRSPIVVAGTGPRRISMARSAVVILDPAVPDNNVADNISSQERTKIVRAARHAARTLVKAEQAMRRGDLREAKKLFNAAWRPPVRKTNQAEARVEEDESILSALWKQFFG